MNPRSLFAVRPGEGRLVGLLAALFATVEAARGIGEVTNLTLFLNRVGSASLPYLYIALGGVSLVVALGFGVGLGRLPRRPFLVGLLVGFGVLLFLLRALIASGDPLTYGVLGVAVTVVNTILLTLLWTMAATALDARQAKRLFPLCTSAAIGGGFIGTLATGPLTAALGSENLIVLAGGLLVLGAGIASRIGRQAGQAVRPVAARSAPASLGAQLRAGFDDVRRSPLLRLVAVAYLLFSVLLFSVQFPYQSSLEEAFRGDDTGLATFGGTVQAAVTATSFVVSLLFANRIYARFGVVTAALSLPVLYLVGFAGWLVQFSLATAVAFSFGQQVVQRSVSNAAWSAMYTVVPRERRPQVLAFMDGVPGQLGASLSGVLLIVAGVLAATSFTPVFVLGLVAAAACTWVVILIRRRYGDALLRTLRAGLGEQVLEGGPGLATIARDQETVAELRRALGDPSASVRALAADVAGRLGDPSVAVALDPLLGDDDPGVRAAALRALAALDAAVGAAAAEGLAGDAEPRVRAEVAVARATAGDRAGSDAVIDELLGSERPSDRAIGLAAAARAATPRVGALAMTALADPAPPVRAAAAEAIAGVLHAETTDEIAATELLVAALDDDAASVRAAAARALAGHEIVTRALVRVLSDGSERAQEAAVHGLAGSDGAASEPIRTWALERVARMTRLRVHGAALRAADLREPGSQGPALGFLRGLIQRRGRRTERQLLAAVAALGAPAATGLLRRSLHAPDPDVRAQAIEAIDALGDRELGRAVVRLLDTDATPSRGDVDAALRALATDPDPWIRAVALRALGDAVTRTYEELRRRGSGDPDPIVRAAAATMAPLGGSPVTDTARTLDELERMVVLSRVPLFSELDPEDLQRIAASAGERLYPSGVSLVEEGEFGDELIVLVEGSVRIVHRRDDGEQLVRTYAAGDHIGELAVLRDRPRAATVIANTDVRGLVIGGEALRAILQERPEAAMAMLATLAERISAQ